MPCCDSASVLIGWAPYVVIKESRFSDFFIRTVQNDDTTLGVCMSKSSSTVRAF